jgi:hypothetical protein
MYGETRFVDLSLLRRYRPFPEEIFGIQAAEYPLIGTRQEIVDENVRPFVVESTLFLFFFPCRTLLHATPYAMWVW